MWQLCNSETEVVIHSGFVYVPLLFDPQIEGELALLTGAEVSPPPGGVVTITDKLLFVDGDYFIQSLSLASLVENFPVVFPEEWERARLRLRRFVIPGASLYQPYLDARLKTILFEILPHFLRPHQDPRRKKVGVAAVLAHLAAKITSNSGKTALVDRLQAQKTSLEQVLDQIEHLKRLPGGPPEHRCRGNELAGWFREAIQAHLASQEIWHWRQELAQVQDLLNLPGPELAVLLGIASRGAVEVDGCGCRPDKRHPGEYLVYKRTGEYVLQDYFGRFYLFPDCRVGVSTSGPFHPMVLDQYKHPLLRHFGSRQQICLTDYQPAQEFSAAAVIKALEEGLNALFYGYNSRKRNGYNSLDKFGRHLSVVDFEDWRIPQDDPRVTDGQVEVKNRFF
jgi:hypothetical protein